MVLNLRTLSPLIVGLVELALAVALGGTAGDLLGILFAVVVSVGLIWGAEFLGSGPFIDVPRGYPSASRPSHPITIALVGWIFLLLMPGLLLWHLWRGSGS